MIEDYRTIKVRFEEAICFLQFYRPEANNTINGEMVDECINLLDNYQHDINILVIEGTPEVFCFGADFQALGNDIASGEGGKTPEELYDLWALLAKGPFVSIAHVRGKVNAGGMGFVAACDIVIADETATFSLSELLFGLLPACVLPFLIRRIGFQKAQYMTLLTQPVGAKEVTDWGLVDAIGPNSQDLLRKHLLRLRRLSKVAISRYKRYMSELNILVDEKRAIAVEANREVFSDRENIAKINRFVQTGKFPWEA